MFASFGRVMRDWWVGEYIPPPKSSIEDGVYIVSVGELRRPWIARLCSWLWVRMRAHPFDWVIATLTALGVLVATLAMLK